MSFTRYLLGYFDKRIQFRSLSLAVKSACSLLRPRTAFGSTKISHIQKLSGLFQLSFLPIGRSNLLTVLNFQNWTESTDPLKFIYEDIAIATYLSLLWADNKMNFVDLGCGNGLLVHILTQEGHRGCGIDIRSRKIWATYPQSTVLKVLVDLTFHMICVSDKSS